MAQSIKIIFANQVLFVFNVWEQVFYDNIKCVLLTTNMDDDLQKELLDDLRKSGKRLLHKLFMKKVFMGLYISAYCALAAVLIYGVHSNDPFSNWVINILSAIVMIMELFVLVRLHQTLFRFQYLSADDLDTTSYAILRICAFIAEVIFFVGIVTSSGLLENIQVIKKSFAMKVLDSIGLL